jgi:DMSO reductase anchor subunit
VIFLTTLIGAGQGLFLAVVTVQAYTLVGLLPPSDPQSFYAVGSVVAEALLAAGLAASFLHLGHPERAWRAATQWRTSWLSREVIALPAMMGVVLLYGAAQWSGFKPVLATLASGVPVDGTVILGLLGALLAFALFVCTAMIYACLPMLREWHTPLTLANFILLGGASGFTLATALALAAAPGLVGFLGAWSLVITALAAVARAATLVRNARLLPRSTLQSAIGVKHPRIVQKSQGAMGGSFNTREFFHGASQPTVRRIRQAAIALGFVVPIAMLLASAATSSMLLAVLASPVQFAGLLAERWVFFADARHPQNLYYASTS